MIRRFGLGLARSSRRGFTLIEIILVVVIILTLAAVVGPKLIGRGRQAKVGATKITINNVKGLLGEFEVNAGRLPTTEEGLEALLKKPSALGDDHWSGPYADALPKDGFNKEFQYRVPSQNGKDYDLISAGPDGQFGTDDDITNFMDVKK